MIARVPAATAILTIGLTAGPVAAQRPAGRSAPEATAAVRTTETALRQRVTEYWKARSVLDLRAAYRFYEPSFRAKYTQDAFVRNFRRLLRFAPEFLGIENISLDGGRRKAAVKVKLRSKPEMLEGTEVVTVNEETWLLVDGVWWREAERLVPNVRLGTRSEARAE